jgi:hypothetical protein
MSRFCTRELAAALMAVLLAVPAAAQEQRGTIEGVVKDASGAVLPGATVEATGESGVVLATATDAAGSFRFPSLAPGTYKIAATLTGFTARSVDDVRVGLGQIKKVDFALAVAGVTESVQVTAESPLVDVRQSARQTNIRAEQVELLPKGRDFTSLVTQAAGANNEGKLGGISIDGASASENRFIIDGIETTDLQRGTSGTALIVDFVDEVQVKSSGYTAEFGGATGGVINAMTKSGTNAWRGSALFNVQGDALTGARRPSLRQTPANDSVAEYITYPEDNSTRVEPGFSLGGPIATNRAWFFGAYQPAFTTTDRSVDASTSQTLLGQPNSSTQRAQVQFATANVTSQMSPAVRTRFAFNNSWSRAKGLLPSLNASDPVGSDYGKTSTFPAYSVSGTLDWVASPSLFFGIRGGYAMSDWYDTNVTEVPLTFWASTNNIGLLDVPASLQRATGFSSVLSNFKANTDQQTRAYVQADGTWFGKFFGAHQVKAGVQVDRVGNEVDSGEAAARVSIRWNSALSGQRGTYGYYSVRSNGDDPRRGLVTTGSVHTTNLGLFVQDAWTIGNRLTVNAGIRTERERIPTYAAGAVIDGAPLPEHGISFDFADKLAPRVGFAYDVKGDGRWKAFGSWGVFYDIFKLELPRGSFGGDKWLEYYYALDTYDWPNLVADPACPPACPGRLLLGPVDFRHVSVGSDFVDPGLKPMRQQEATAGLEHQVNDVVALSVRYVHKQVDRAVEDTGALDANQNEIYVVANPGEGLTQFAHPGVPLPKAVRDYDSVELALEKRFASNWYLRTSYLWSRLFGNYSGLSQSDENGRTSPNVGRLWDYPMMMFADGGIATYGPLATDRPHQFKTQFIYQFGFGTSVGLNQFVASGLPVTREIGIYPPNNLPVQYLGRGSDGRTPVFSQTDLSLQHRLQLGGTRSVQLELNVLNLFNQDAAVSRHATYQKTAGVRPNENAFYAGTEMLATLITTQGVVQDPRFLMDNGFQAPISARFGVKFLF